MKKALVVVDPQNIYTDPNSEMYCEDSTKTIERINALISNFTTQGAPIIFFRHVHKADGSDLGRMFDYAGDDDLEFNFKEGTPEVEYDERVSVPKDAVHFIKNRYSGFSNPDFGKYLNRQKIEGVTICGFMTNFCCESTAREAHDRDYFVDFILDATGSPGTDNLNEKKVREVVGELLGEGYCVVYSTKEYLKA